MVRRIRESFLRSHDGQERLWKIWWLCGIPVAWLTSALLIAGEELRVAGHAVAADWLDVARILLYALWARLAWQCAHNVGAWIWSPVSRGALSAGLVLMVLL
jgi:hypothetical protein